MTITQRCLVGWFHNKPFMSWTLFHWSAYFWHDDNYLKMLGGVVSQWNMLSNEYDMIWEDEITWRCQVCIETLWHDDSYLNVFGGVVSQGKTAPPPDTAVVLNLEPATRTHCFFSLILFCVFVLLFSEHDFASSFSLYFDNFISFVHFFVWDFSCSMKPRQLCIYTIDSIDWHCLLVQFFLSLAICLTASYHICASVSFV